MNNFEHEVNERIAAYPQNKELLLAARQFMGESIKNKYSYNFTWLGRSIIQYPQDIVAIQELIWQVKPDLIIETGIAHGGSLMLSASLLALLDIAEVIEKAYRNGIHANQNERFWGLISKSGLTTVRLLRHTLCLAVSR